jgi:hypothetical protein
MRRRRGGQVIEMIAGIALEKPQTLTEPKAASGRRLAYPGAAVTPRSARHPCGLRIHQPLQVYVALSILL